MSEIRATTISNAAGTGPITMTGQYAAKAWVNFNGTGTVAIRDGGNVSSITDNGTGDYTINFTTAMQDANYSNAATGCRDNINYGYAAITIPYQGSQTTSSVRLISYPSTPGDYQYVSAQIFR